MEYNTSRKKLVLPEYGRNIQRMVELTKAEPDDEKRNKMAKAIIAIMGNMNPHLRDIVDFKHKLWDHLAIISEFDLDKNLFFKVRRVMRKKLERRLTKNKYREVIKGKASGLWVSMSNDDILRLVDHIVRDQESQI